MHKPSLHLNPNLYLFPLLGGSAWFLTLATLLIYWLAVGQPTYPHQSNPYVAFISDIGAHALKPVFILGGTLTAFAYTGTIFAVNYSRSHLHGLQDDPRWKQGFSAVALMGGVAAGVACVLLTIFDTDRFNGMHELMLLLAFGGIATSAIATSMVYADVTFGNKASIGERNLRGLQRWCRASFALVAVEVVIGVAFTVCLKGTRQLKVAGFLEWTIAFLGAFYIWGFMGFVRVRDDGQSAGNETEPLLTRRD